MLLVGCGACVASGFQRNSTQLTIASKNIKLACRLQPNQRLAV